MLVVAVGEAVLVALVAAAVAVPQFAAGGVLVAGGLGLRALVGEGRVDALVAGMSFIRW